MNRCLDYLQRKDCALTVEIKYKMLDTADPFIIARAVVSPEGEVIDVYDPFNVSITNDTQGCRISFERRNVFEYTGTALNPPLILPQRFTSHDRVQVTDICAMLDPNLGKITFVDAINLFADSIKSLSFLRQENRVLVITAKNQIFKELPPIIVARAVVAPNGNIIDMYNPFKMTVYKDPCGYQITTERSKIANTAGNVCEPPLIFPDEYETYTEITLADACDLLSSEDVNGKAFPEIIQRFSALLN